jgi:hypothetical protein
MIPSKILMLRPAAFGYNPETATDNHFIAEPLPFYGANALAEFDAFAQKLSDAGISLCIASDAPNPPKPDAVYLNNWFCVLPDHTLVLFPMHSANRRAERTPELIKKICAEAQISRVLDLTYLEKEGLSLEGTGSMVFDHEAQKVYVCRSARSHPRAVDIFCQKTQYAPCLFSAIDQNGLPVYHTNVMLSIAGKYAVICSESIPDISEREILLQTLARSQRSIIDITRGQMADFAANIFQLTATDGSKITVMSERAHRALSEEQRSIISKTDTILFAPLNTFENTGGGSARCMIAALAYE